MPKVNHEKTRPTTPSTRLATARPEFCGGEGVATVTRGLPVAWPNPGIWSCRAMARHQPNRQLATSAYSRDAGRAVGAEGSPKRSRSHGERNPFGGVCGFQRMRSRTSDPPRGRPPCKPKAPPQQHENDPRRRQRAVRAESGAPLSRARPRSAPPCKTAAQTTADRRAPKRADNGWSRRPGTGRSTG